MNSQIQRDCEMLLSEQIIVMRIGLRLPPLISLENTAPFRQSLLKSPHPLIYIYVIHGTVKKPVMLPYQFGFFQYWRLEKGMGVMKLSMARKSW